MASATAPLPSLDAVKLAFAESGRPPFPKDDHAATTSQATARQGFALWTGLYRIMDTGAALAALVFTFVVTNLSAMPRGLAAFMAVRITLRSVLYLTLFAVVWRGVFSAFGLYDAARLTSGKEEASRILAACSFGSLCALVFPLSSASGRFGPDTLGLFFLAVTGITLALRWLILVPTRVGYGAPERHVIIIGSGPRAVRCDQELRRRAGSRYHVLGFVDSNAGEWQPELATRMLGGLDQLEAVLAQSAVDEVHIALPIKSCYDQFQRVIQICELAGLPVSYQLDAFRHGSTASRSGDADGQPVVKTIVVPKEERLIVKRAFDIVCAGIGIVLIWPVLLIIATAIKLTSAGPVIFAQQRYGKGKRPFKMYKFRSMRVDAEALLRNSPVLYDEYRKNGFKLPGNQDPRITRLGRFLRRTSLDELPQLWNVLRGQMAIVGPRPIVPGELDNYGPAACLLLALKPGLTGAWVVGGRSQIGYPRRAALELQYVRSWNLLLDIAILLRTVPMIIWQRGAH